MITRISITVPFADAKLRAGLWAGEERQIDFRREPERGARCTLAFAAVELKEHLLRTLEDAEVLIDERPPADAFHVELGLEAGLGAADGFRLEPSVRGLRIYGQSRAGLLYGAYEFLRMQGWRWYAPGLLGETVPVRRRELVLPRQTVVSGSLMPLGRGFDFEGVSKESAELLLWMARNRLNLCGCRLNTTALARKLGMTLCAVGHIFEAMLAPDRPLPSGRTLWEEHPDWYGLPASGRYRKDEALNTQFCVCRPELVRFVADELVALLMGDLREADRLAIWGFDTWGSTCCCPACRALGNSTDRALHFLSQLRHALAQERTAGRLDHEVTLTTNGYEGNDTLQPPAGATPQNLIEAGDLCTFYPINRCYRHDFADAQCPTNTRYRQALEGRLRAQPVQPLRIGEYYNVSKFEDLPLLFTTRIAHDIPFYVGLGVRGITYMHVPLVNWAMRALTQSLYAQLAWDPRTDVAEFLREYFHGYYGPHAPVMRQVYERIEKAWQMISQWRSWAVDSVLSRLMMWDGRRPPAPLAIDAHFSSVADAIAQGRDAVRLLEEAMILLRQAQAGERARTAAEPSVPPNRALNPEAVEFVRASVYTTRLGEDRRLLRYGLDVMRLTSELLAYHEAFRCGAKREAEAAWQEVESVADALDNYYIPLGYDGKEAGVRSKDGLTRSQLRATLERCRQARRELGAVGG
ncbi:MAG TPA: hypothetical protein DCX07_15790 [Phycisphaerales bacterium]|nr:hypothetical protein [Phycisphaerales bacterium]